MKAQITAACAEVFFPELTEGKRQSLARALKANASRASFCQAAAKLFAAWPGEDRLRLFSDFATSLASASEYWKSGTDRDVLDSFPAARLIRVIDDAHDGVDWPARWIARGGRLYAGQMVALKWDRVWQQISDFYLPFPPFALASGMDVEDVDRDEAEALRLLSRRSPIPSISLEFDAPDFERRLAAKLPPPLPR